MPGFFVIFFSDWPESWLALVRPLRKSYEFVV